MKKLTYVLPGILLAVILVAVMCVIGIFRIPVPKADSLTVLDSEDQVIAELSSPEAVRSDPRWAYLEYVMDEAAQVYAGQNAVTREEAVKLLFTGNCNLKTALDPAVCSAVDGNLVAIYSTDGEENQARRKTSPYSVLKPLSVYAPAVEAGISHWSVRYQDTPYKQLPQESGGGDWPANASGKYSGEKVFMHQAVKESLNTVAVKSLADLGVDNAIAFLRGNFPLDLATEAMRLEQEGQEEISATLL